MALPYFYVAQIEADAITLDEDASKHITQVLRMKVGEELLLTDGKRTKAKGHITDDHRKRCVVTIDKRESEPAAPVKIAVAISLVKNAARFEWFLEKATEIGVQEIIPLLCERTEKEKFRQDRLQNILTSAMLQSQQAWLPILHEPVKFKEVIKNSTRHNKFIAHCDEDKKTDLAKIINHKNVGTSQVLPMGEDLGGALILIGPEGDFTKEEIDLAKQNNFIPVSLGNTRLRTETAGIVAAVLLNQK